MPNYPIAFDVPTKIGYLLNVYANMSIVCVYMFTLCVFVVIIDTCSIVALSFSSMIAFFYVRLSGDGELTIVGMPVF